MKKNGKGRIAMHYNQGFEQRLLVEVSSTRNDGITLMGNLYEEFNNIYGIAHGGYLYTVAHIAACKTGELCVGGDWEVEGAQCLFLHPLRIYPSVTETTLLSREDRPLVRCQVHDNKGNLCFEMHATLRPAKERAGEKVTHTPTIITDRRLPKDPNEKPQFPCLSSTYSKWLNIYSTSMTDSTIVYSADLTEINCDDMGYLHPAVMFTAADCSAGGCLFYIDKRRPITVSANIHYLRHTCKGPVHAVPRPIRKGNVLNFYEVDLVDGDGEIAAVSQFIIRDMDKK